MLLWQKKEFVKNLFQLVFYKYTLSRKTANYHQAKDEIKRVFKLVSLFSLFNAIFES